MSTRPPQPTFPPPGFIQAPSHVEGIEVWKPDDTQPALKEVVGFRCPSCGASITYSLEQSGLACPHCGYREDAAPALLGLSAQEFEFTVETVARAARGWGDERREVECEQCGAITAVPPGQVSGTCPFCGSARVIQREPAQDALRPRALLPFTVDPAACQANLAAWLGSSWMAPPALAQLANTVTLTPIYIPCWTFDSSAAAAWRAEVGHTVTTGSGKNRRTHTVWRWESGNVSQSFDDTLVPGTARVSRVLFEQAGVYQLDALVAYEPKLLAGLSAQAYDVTLDQAWGMVRERWRDGVRTLCLTKPSTSKVRNFSMDLDYADERWRYILAPLYIAAYQYQGRPFQVIVNGQTGAVAGQRPADWVRVGLATAGMLLPGIIALVAVSIYAAQAATAEVSSDAPGFLMIGALIVLAIGGFFAFQTVRQAMRLDDV